MTKIKRSVTISAELDNVISRVASQLQQSTSQLIEFRLREDPQIKTMLDQLRKASDPPSNEIRKRKVLPA